MGPERGERVDLLEDVLLRELVLEEGLAAGELRLPSREVEDLLLEGVGLVGLARDRGLLPPLGRGGGGVVVVVVAAAAPRPQGGRASPSKLAPASLA